MLRSFAAFALVTLLPLPLLIAGALFGGWAVWGALVYVTLFIAAVDEFVPPLTSDAPASDPDSAEVLSLMLAGAHGLILLVVIWSLSGHGTGLFSLTGLGLFVAAGLFFGQVSNSNAHELIHRPQRHLNLIGVAIYVSLLFGHHASAHPTVHHIHVGTPKDPNTARLNESFWRYVKRAWTGSYRAGLTVEKARLARRGLRPWNLRNPYILYWGGAGVALCVSFLIGGLAGIGVHLALAAFAQSQLLVSDYVQHYGLERRENDDGRYEPVGPEHSWNAPHWLSSLWMLNAPHHSDHHAHPGKSFTELSTPEQGTAPMLPYGLPVMACLALWPKHWKRVMTPRAEQWREKTLLEI